MTHELDSINRLVGFNIALVFHQCDAIWPVINLYFLFSDIIDIIDSIDGSDISDSCNSSDIRDWTQVHKLVSTSVRKYICTRVPKYKGLKYTSLPILRT